MTKKAAINWDQLGFDYIKTDYRYLSFWKDDQWDGGTLTEDNVLHLGEAAPCLHYGQQCFEGLKAYRTKNGDIQLFRIDQNARRLQDSCDRLLMPTISEETFIKACVDVVKANEAYIPALRHRRFAIYPSDDDWGRQQRGGQTGQ
jgi:branched chain amino acid aminotransferase (EC 2.6.1.42)